MTEIADIQKPFAKWLRERGLPFVQARSDEKSTIASGHPDFSVFWRGKVLFIECKTEEGKLSPKQAAKIKQLEYAGCPVTIARSLQECISAVQAWIGASEAPTEAPAREKWRPDPSIRIVNWAGIDAIVKLRTDGADFVRLARPDDLLSIPRA